MPKSERSSIALSCDENSRLSNLFHSRGSLSFLRVDWRERGLCALRDAPLDITLADITLADPSIHRLAFDPLNPFLPPHPFPHNTLPVNAHVHASHTLNVLSSNALRDQAESGCLKFPRVTCDASKPALVHCPLPAVRRPPLHSMA